MECSDSNVNMGTISKRFSIDDDKLQSGVIFLKNSHGESEIMKRINEKQILIAFLIYWEHHNY